VEEIIAVMRIAGDDVHGARAPADDPGQRQPPTLIRTDIPAGAKHATRAPPGMSISAAASSLTGQRVAFVPNQDGWKG
jgi:hypothetical protein